jgi:ketosteroid isomerase-like protein
MADSKSLAVARAYHRAWSTRDLDEVGRYLADDLQIEVPINSYAGKADFLEAVLRTAQHTSSVRMIAELGDGDEAMLLYDMTLPIGQLRVAEHFTISGGKIHKVRQIHDTAALRAAGMGG